MRHGIGLSLLLWISGCSWMGDKDSLLPQEGPTMLEIYQGHFDGTWPKTTKPRESRLDTQRSVMAQRPIHPGTMDQSEITHPVVSRLLQRFATLPNPTLLLYVYPHLSGDHQFPVPGYYTAFPLYETTQFALPGEVEGHL